MSAQLHTMKTSAQKMQPDVVRPTSTEAIPASLHNLIDQIETQEKPWFLKTAEIYQVAKDAALAIPMGEALFEKSLESVSAVTNVIQENTHLNVAFDVEYSHELINNIDGMVAALFHRADDGLDSLRTQLAVNLRALLAAIVVHKNWALTEAHVQQDKAVVIVRTRYEQALEVLHTIVDTVQTLRQDAISRGVDAVYSTQSKVHEYADKNKNKLVALSQSTGVTGLALRLLDLAQPYVQYTVVKGGPLVEAALVKYQPYVELAKPVVEPLINKAKEIDERAAQNKFLAPYVTKAHEAAHFVLEETKSYCLPVY